MVERHVDWKLRKIAGEERAYALATLAELVLLGTAYGGAGFKSGQAEQDIKQCCEEMLGLLGPGPFPILSTRRQFRPYLEYWQREQWDDLARTALLALGDESPPWKCAARPRELSGCSGGRLS